MMFIFIYYYILYIYIYIEFLQAPHPITMIHSRHSLSVSMFDDFDWFPDGPGHFLIAKFLKEVGQILQSRWVLLFNFTVFFDM